MISNGYRTRGWKTQLADPAAETGLEVTVCHLPPGTSKWNKIEHRLFSHITMNWRGRPLTSHEVMLQIIAATTSRTGLTVQAELDSGEYPTGIRVSDDEIAALPITRHCFHGDWNYTLHPQRPTDTATTTSTQDEAGADQPAHLTRHSPQDPELTGMTRRQLNELIDVLTPAMEIQREQCSAPAEATNAWWPLAQAPNPSSPQQTRSWPPCSTCEISRPWTSWASSSRTSHGSAEVAENAAVPKTRVPAQHGAADVG